MSDNSDIGAVSAPTATPEALAKETYESSHYLLFGLPPQSAYDLLDCPGTAEYLAERGFADNSLTQARKQKRTSGQYAGFHDPQAHYCDFCGKALFGGEWEILKDGRERCTECAETVLNKCEDFEALYLQTRDGLCAKYGVKLTPPIKVKVVSQARLARATGSKYAPTPFFDARAVGLAVEKKGVYTLYLENGTPKASLLATTAHELTHIWQYTNWDWKAMKDKYGNYFLAICEGMAKWSEIQYLYLLNETDYADRHLANEVARKDVYGYGLRLFLNQYPLTKDIVLIGRTPFSDPRNPIGLP